MSRFPRVTRISDNCCYPKAYDWLLIFPQEVKYIWRSSWNYTKVLYLLARYAPFAGTALMIRSKFPFRLSTHCLPVSIPRFPPEWNLCHVRA